MCVLVVITRQEEIQVTVQWGLRFSRARELPLVVVYPEVYPQETPPVQLPLDETHSNPLIEEIRQAMVALELKEGEEEPALRYLQHPDRFGALMQMIKEQKVSLLVTGHSSLRDSKDESEPSLRRSLLEEAPCDVMLLRAGEDKKISECNKILIPASGGPHAMAALQMSAALADKTDAKVKAVYIEQEAGEYAEAVGQRILRRVMETAKIEGHSKVSTGVVLADDVGEGIVQAAKEEGKIDLLILGASNVGFVRRTLFGTVPDSFLEGKHPMTIAVMRSAQPLVERVRGAMVELFDRFVPQLEREERIELFERLQHGSTARLDFIALICLSTAIAALGLLQNSGAVIIGAMLVAPLMTPMLGTGLGLVQGNIVLVKRAAIAIGLGFFLSFAIGLTIGFVVPSFQALTPEMSARGAPNLLDLFVALFSGVAAAYALARPGLLEALPGVAIAAALVPPIATAGASLAIGQTANALGAASLFGINLVAIILASASTLYVLGVRAKKGQKRLWSRRVLIGLFLLSFLLAFPLGTALLSQIPAPFKPMQRALQQHLKTHTQPGASIASVLRSSRRGKQTIVLQIYTPKRIKPKTAQQLGAIVRKYAGKKTHVRVVSILFVDVPAQK